MLLNSGFVEQKPKKLIATRQYSRADFMLLSIAPSANQADSPCLPTFGYWYYGQGQSCGLSDQNTQSNISHLLSFSPGLGQYKSECLDNDTKNKDHRSALSQPRNCSCHTARCTCGQSLGYYLISNLENTVCRRPA